MPDRPFLSVIIPTFNRWAYLEKVLRALAEQDLQKDLFELIVVDDGSRDETPRAMATFSGLQNLRYVRKENSGPADAKNLGIYMAKGKVVLFLDDDDIPARSLLSTHLATHQQNPDPSVAVLGYTELAEELKTDPLLRYVTTVGYQYCCYPLFEDGSLLDWQAFWGGRSSVKRSFLLEHDGLFNPIFKFHEDIELGLRLARHGLKVLFNKKARSILVRNPGFDEICKREFLKGKYHYLLSYLYDHRQLRKYTRNWEKKWRILSFFHEQGYESVKKLHESIQWRIKEGLELDGATETTLFSAYKRVFESFYYKGMSEGPQLVEELGKKGYLVACRRKGKVLFMCRDSPLALPGARKRKQGHPFAGKSGGQAGAEKIFVQLGSCWKEPISKARGLFSGKKRLFPPGLFKGIKNLFLFLNK